MSLEERYRSADDVIATDRLSERPSRPPDYAAENRVLQALAAELAERPENLLQKLAETLVQLGVADSAGISIEETAGVRQFRWVALAGVWSQFRWGTIPFDASPCGIAVERDKLILIESPERFFPGANAEPLIHEGLLLPFHARGRPVGTIWINAHNPTRKFDREDARLLEGLARFASAGYQMSLALRAAEAGRSESDARLRASEKQQAFLLELSDSLRRLADPIAIEEQATRLLARQLDVSRAVYATFVVEGGREYVVIEREHRAPGTPSLVGRHLAEATSDDNESLRAGRATVIPDIETEPMSEARRAGWQALGARARMGVPLVKEGRLAVVLGVHDSAPRAWTPQDVELVREVGERTWAAIERARAEGALRTSEEKYRTLFETMGQGFIELKVIHDKKGEPVDLQYIELNPAFERQFGVPVGLARGKRASEFFPGFDPSWAQAFDRVAQTGQPTRIEQILVNDRWFEVFAHPTAGGHVVALYDDVTQRKRAEKVLRESEERQAFLLKLSDTLRPLSSVHEIRRAAMDVVGQQLGVDCVVYGDISPDTRTGIAPYAYTRGDFPPIAGAYDMDSFGSAAAAMREGTTYILRDVENDPAYPVEKRAPYRALGVRAIVAVPLIKKGRWISTIIAYQREPRRWTAEEIELLRETLERTWEAVERARAEDALRESEGRFRQFADASSGALWIRNATTLKMEYVSPAIADIYGVKPETFLDGVEVWASSIVPEDRDVALEHLDRARQGEAVVHEFRIQRPSDQAFRWIRNTDFPLYDASEQIERIGGIAEDVTETKIAIEHQGVLLHELQHRVRNLMGIIRSIGNRSANGANSVEDYRVALEGRMLALARVQALLTREANAGGWLRDIIESEVKVQANHQHQFELVGPDIMLAPKAVEVLTLALHELSTNALKYGAFSVPEGRLVVSWSPFEKRGTQWLGLDWVETGAPQRAPSTRRGFGSELIEARIPYELGGTSKVSIEPSGARCRMEFPLKDAESILETDSPVPTSTFGGTIDMTGAPDLSGRTILVVEDDYYLASDTAAALRGAGATVLGPCSSEESALAMLDEATPSHAVLDLNLGGGGPRFEVAKSLRHRGVPFVFLTGYDPEVIPTDLVDVTRLQKPVPFKSIVEAVSQL